MTNGEKIELLMNSRGLNRKQFGQICGVSGETVGEWIRNKSKPSKIAQDKMESTFGIDINKLMDDKFPSVSEGDRPELRYLILGDYNLEAMLNELREVILNDYNLKFEGRLVDKQIRKIIADSIQIGVELARQNILESK